MNLIQIASYTQGITRPFVYLKRPVIFLRFMSSRVAFSLFAEQCLLDTYTRHYEVTICTSNRFLTYQQVVKTNPSNSKLFCGFFCEICYPDVYYFKILSESAHKQ